MTKKQWQGTFLNALIPRLANDVNLKQICMWLCISTSSKHDWTRLLDSDRFLSSVTSVRLELWGVENDSEYEWARDLYRSDLKRLDKQGRLTVINYRMRS